MARTVRFEIEYTPTCPGVDVSVLSVFPGEKEVLFSPCTGLRLAKADAKSRTEEGGPRRGEGVPHGPCS